MILGFFMGIIIMSAIGCLLGFGLAWLARVMAVETDPKTEQILAVLPGANCGACGFANYQNGRSGRIFGLNHRGESGQNAKHV